MFSRVNRLAKAKNISLVYKQGRNFFNSVFTVKFLSANKPGFHRFAIVVPNKVAKNAVDRNKIKRIVREFLKTKILALKPGDYMIIVKNRAITLSSSELKISLDELFLSKRCYI